MWSQDHPCSWDLHFTRLEYKARMVVFFVCFLKRFWFMSKIRLFSSTPEIPWKTPPLRYGYTPCNHGWRNTMDEILCRYGSLIRFAREMLRFLMSLMRKARLQKWRELAKDPWKSKWEKWHSNPRLGFHTQHRTPCSEHSPKGGSHFTMHCPDQSFQLPWETHMILQIFYQIR